MTDPILQLEWALDKAVADFKRFHAEHPDEDVDVPLEAIDAVTDKILAMPLRSLGDVRLAAKAILVDTANGETHSDAVWPLLRVLQVLPPRLWELPIGEA